jgi:hypothetical protein
MFKNLCANELALDQYLRKLDRDDKREAAIEDCIDELMIGNYSPDDYSNFIEAVTEIDVETMKRIILEIALAKRKTDKDDADVHFLLAGRALSQAVFDYWTKSARSEAEHQIDTADCQHCFDHGCRRCTPEN